MLGEEAEGWNGKHERSEGLHKRSAEDCGKPLAPRQGRALSEVWFPYPRASSTQESSGSRCGRNRPQRRERKTRSGKSVGGDFLPHSDGFKLND